MKKSVKLTVFVSIPLLAVGLVVFFSTIGYLGPKAPRLDVDSEIHDLALLLNGGDIGPWYPVEELLQSFDGMTTEGDARTAGEAFNSMRRSKGDPEDPIAIQQRLGSWTTALDAARLRELAQTAAGSKPFAEQDELSSQTFRFRGISIAAYTNAQFRSRLGDISPAIDHIHTLLALSSIADGQPSRMSRLIGMEIHSLAVMATLELLSDHELSAAQLESLNSAHNKYQTPDPLVYLESEWIEANATVDGKFGESVFISRSRSALLLKLRVMIDKAAEEFKTGDIDHEWWGHYQDSLTGPYETVEYLTPNIGRPRVLENVARTMHAGVRLAIAIERFVKQHGTLPKSLSQLVPSFIDHLPEDRVSGEPFIYRENNSARGYTLYSLGDNRTDDLGEVLPEKTPLDALEKRRMGDAVFIPYARPRSNSSED